MLAQHIKVLRNLLYFLLILPFTVVLAQTDNHYITIGTGGVTGVYYPAGGAICFFLNQTRRQHGIRCSVESTGGSISNLMSIREHDLDIGIVQSDWQYHDVKGSGKFSNLGKDTHLRALFSLYPEPFTVVARKDADIKTFSDLLGKRVNIGNPGSGQRATFEVLRDLLGWKNSQFKQVTELVSGEQSRALCANKIDAMIYMVGLPSGSVKEATTACDSRIIPISDKIVNKMIRKYPYYRKAMIPGGMYKGTDKNVHTFGVGATVVTSDALSNKVAYQLVKAVFSNFEAFKNMHPALANLKKSRMIKDFLTAPLHPGAIKYFKEVGLLP